MRAPTTQLSLTLCGLLSCSIALLQALPVAKHGTDISDIVAAAPTTVPVNPVFYKRFVRRRPSSHHSQLDVFELREIYYITRSTTKSPRQISDEEMDRYIRCDFDNSRPECGAARATAAPMTTTRMPPTTTTTETTTTTTARTTTEPLNKTTSTDLPLLPELSDYTEALTTITSKERADYEIQSEDDAQDDDDIVEIAEGEEEGEDVDEDYYAQLEHGQGSIGGLDVGA